MSFHEAGSDISRLNRDACDAAVTVHSDTYEVIRRSLAIADASRGVFDITVAAELVGWGFLPNPGSRRQPDPRASWRDIELLGSDKIRFHRPLWIDLGGIAKGFAVDRALEAMKLDSGTQCRVNAGGDLRVSGPFTERVILRATMVRGDSIPVIEIENGSVASSSGSENRRRAEEGWLGPHVYGGRHKSVGTRSFVSVVAQECVVADALTKVVLAKGARSDRLLKQFEATAHLYSPQQGWRSLGVAA